MIITYFSVLKIDLSYNLNWQVSSERPRLVKSVFEGPQTYRQKVIVLIADLIQLDFLENGVKGYWSCTL